MSGSERKDGARLGGQVEQESEQKKTAAERARVREIAGYLSSACSTLDDFEHHEGEEMKPASLNPDPMLQSLTQLAALRTNSDRSFVSLIDDKHQYVISESTRTHNVRENDLYTNAGDQLFIGVRKLDITFGVCPRTIEVFTDNTGLCAVNTDNIVSNKQCYIIKDFQADSHYLTRPYVSGFPHMRSYAEVPLTTPLGYCIGSLCVVDNKLRQYETDDTVAILSEIAPTIMRHLDMVRKTRNRTRGEQLIEGLVSFMEGEKERLLEEDGHEEDGVSKKSENLTYATSTTAEDAHQADSECGQQATEDVMESEVTINGTAGRPTISRFSFTTASTSAGFTVEDLAAIARTKRNERSTSTPLSSPPVSDEGQFNFTPEHPAKAVTPATTSTGETPAPDPKISSETLRHTSVSGDIKTGFSRAASLILQAMNLTGMSFLDACPSSFGASSNLQTPVEQDDRFDGNGMLNQMQERAYSDAPALAIARAVAHPERYAEAIRTNNTSYLTERQLQRMIRRWPKGSIFTADEFGMIDERFRPDQKVPSSLRARGDRRNPDRAIVEMLFRILGDARYLAFLPMWHFQKERFFAAAFCWVSDPCQGFDTKDLTYLSAFNNSLMAEVSRMEALAISRAKSDFISSISHELRSPLHGILASAELLKEASSESDSKSMISMIESCGRTLLDTMEHLLDFAKINRLSPGTDDPKNDQSAGGQQSNPLATKTTEDICMLVQDVTEAVCIGHAARFAFHNDLQSSKVIAGQPAEHPVLITLNIEPRASWLFDIQVGAWKRNLINIFGNALKYTRSGNIEVSLRMARDAESNQPMICFAVKDTGIGMSSDFQRYMLCQPFAQENILAPGTGLGLSIVKQIVGSLGGRLDIQSAIGIGTHVKVFMPVDRASDPNASDAGPLDPEGILKGKTIRIIKAEECPNHAQRALEMASADVERVHAVKESLQAIATSWLDMSVKTSGSADFVVVDKAVLGSEATHDALAPLNLTNQPIILICYDPPQKTATLPPGTVRLWHPLGPRKLASALLHALASSGSKLAPKARLSNPGLLERNQSLFEVPTSNGLVLVDAASPVPLYAKSPLQGGLTGTSRQEGLTRSNGVATAARHHQSPLAGVLNGSRQGNQRKPHLLLVDDNPINLKLLSTLAKRLGCTYTTAANGLEAVDAFKAAAFAALGPNQKSPGAPPTPPVPMPCFDLIFMDISMPVMNGFVSTREIRAFEREQRLPASQIVALTGLGNDNDRREAFASGMQLFLTKPAKLADVKKLLDAATNFQTSTSPAAPAAGTPTPQTITPDASNLTIQTAPGSVSTSASRALPGAMS